MPIYHCARHITTVKCQETFIRKSNSLLCKDKPILYLRSGFLNMIGTGNQKVAFITGGWASIHLREYKDFMELVCQLLVQVKVKVCLSMPLMHTGEVHNHSFLTRR